MVHLLVRTPVGHHHLQVVVRVGEDVVDLADENVELVDDVVNATEVTVELRLDLVEDILDLAVEVSLQTLELTVHVVNDGLDLGNDLRLNLALYATKSVCKCVDKGFESTGTGVTYLATLICQRDLNGMGLVS